MKETERHAPIAGVDDVEKARYHVVRVHQRDMGLDDPLTEAVEGEHSGSDPQGLDARISHDFRYPAPPARRLRKPLGLRCWSRRRSCTSSSARTCCPRRAPLSPPLRWPDRSCPTTPEK